MNGPIKLFFWEPNKNVIGMFQVGYFRFHFYNVRRMFLERSLNLKGKFYERSGNQKLTSPEPKFVCWEDV